MLSLKQKIAAAIATVTMLGPVLVSTPAFANVDVTISNNGANSTNNATVVVSTSTNVVQDNNTDVNLNVNSSADTGNNTASNNTGGNVTIHTGNATSNVTTNVGGSTNNATVTPCGCNQTVNVAIDKNGIGSMNDATVVKSHALSVSQMNKTKLNKIVWSKAKTGENNANDNTNGTVNVTTGNANSTVNTTVNGSSNSSP